VGPGNFAGEVAVSVGSGAPERGGLGAGAAGPAAVSQPRRRSKRRATSSALSEEIRAFPCITHPVVEFTQTYISPPSAELCTPVSPEANHERTLLVLEKRRSFHEELVLSEAWTSEAWGA
jgi:hypothetical protein